MSSKWGWVTFVVFTGLFLADGAMAQQGRRGGGMLGRGNMIGLLGNEAVQKELGIGESEKEKLTSIGQAYGEDIREQFSGAGDFQNATPEERQKMMAKFQETNQKLMAKYVPQIKEALKPEQFTRVQQISWQAGGSAAFSDPELAKTLDISKEQQEKIAALNQEYAQKQGALFTGGGGGQEAFAKLRELSQERDQKATEILTKEQKEKFEQLKGKPFDLAQLGGPGGGRPGGRKGDKKE
jgi:Spy/CpxP family protein refolding chaperone